MDNWGQSTNRSSSAIPLVLLGTVAALLMYRGLEHASHSADEYWPSTQPGSYSSGYHGSSYGYGSGGYGHGNYSGTTRGGFGGSGHFAGS